MKIREIDTPQGCLEYKIIDGKAHIIGYRGRDFVIEVPESIEDYPVTVIGKKAFLSNKKLRQISLPIGITMIEDWAFACCSHLENLKIPYQKIELGQGIFKDCFSLLQIENSGIPDMKVSKDKEDISYLLAAVTTFPDAFYLLDFANAGNEEWLKKWDHRLERQIKLDDADGFSKMLLCGEEDYGSKENNLHYYMEQQRKGKVRISMLRLLHNFGLKDSLRNKLIDYLLLHTKGEKTEETWMVVLEEHGSEKAYFDLLIEIGAVKDECFQSMLHDMGEAYPEMKAYLMRHHNEKKANRDAFAMFAL